MDKLPSIYTNMKNFAATNKNSADLIITTAHKAKGTEYSQVKLLDDFINIEQLLKQSKNIKVNISVEELHLLYVAITRSCNNLDFPDYINIDKNIINNFLDAVKKEKMILN
jgi:ATP-dependent exoDNAse (exonuclease V) beta subunit